MNKAIFNIIQEMSQFLTIEQLQELQKSLIRNLVDAKTQEITEISNWNESWRDIHA